VERFFVASENDWPEDGREDVVVDEGRDSEDADDREDDGREDEE